MQIRQLPKSVLNYLWNLEFGKYADEDKFANLREELKKFGYEITDEDYIEGEYTDLRGYLNFNIKEK